MKKCHKQVHMNGHYCENDRAYSRKQGHTCGITKKGQKSLVKGHNCRFLFLTFPNLGHLGH